MYWSKVRWPYKSVINIFLYGLLGGGGGRSRRDRRRGGHLPLLLSHVELDVLVAICLNLRSVVLRTRPGSGSLSTGGCSRGILIHGVETNELVLGASVPHLNRGFVVKASANAPSKALAYHHGSGARCGGLCSYLELEIGAYEHSRITL